MINKLTARLRRCIDDYDMIESGETVAIGVSGGKDSLALLYAFSDLQKYHPKNFKLHAVTLDMGIKGMDFSPVKNLCKKLDVPFTLEFSNIARVIFEERMDKNPCALCASMRRAVLCKIIKKHGISKIALAHHFDDAVETFLMSLLYEGRIHCFQPVTYLNRMDVTQIRPMLYIEEKMIKRFIEVNKITVVQNPCPKNGHSKREEIKTLLKTLSIDHKDIKKKIFGAIKRLPLKGWQV